jgi:hypothetical protein
MNPPGDKPSVEELFSDLEEKGLTRDEINAYLDQARAERAGRAAQDAVGSTDPLDDISAKLDRLQGSVDALAEKLDRE